jgi:xanthine dehydrogenase YagS FAD-binding subunit
MRPFAYKFPSDVREAAAGSAEDNTAFIAGGTTMIDLMKLEVLKPGQLVDLNNLPLRGIDLGSGGLRIGALEKMSDVAANSKVATHYPVISEALLQSASAQIRNMASMEGNLLQRTRCGYFRDVNTPCNKRQSGSGCPAMEKTPIELSTADFRRALTRGIRHWPTSNSIVRPRKAAN